MLTIVGGPGAGRSRELRSFDVPLLNVLDLLPDPLELRLQLDHVLGQRGVVGLRADGIRLAPELLEQEIQAPPDRLSPVRARQDLAKLCDMASEADELLGDVQSVRRDHDLLMEPRLVEQADLPSDLFGAASEPLPSGVDDLPGALLEGFRERLDAAETSLELPGERLPLARAHRDQRRDRLVDGLLERPAERLRIGLGLD